MRPHGFSALSELARNAALERTPPVRFNTSTRLPRRAFPGAENASRGNASTLPTDPTQASNERRETSTAPSLVRPELRRRDEPRAEPARRGLARRAPDDRPLSSLRGCRLRAD